MADLVVAGAGMAGLSAAARARELGADVDLLEKGSRPGGSMLLSSGFIWRHRRFEDFRAECPGGDERLQRCVWERLDGALDWLEDLGAEVTARDTGNPLTTGRRFDTRSLTAALCKNGDGSLSCTPGTEPFLARPLILATGGFAADPELVGRYITTEPVVLRSNRWSSGDGLRAGLEAGASLSAGMDEFYGRALPAAPVAPEDFVGLAQLYARHATVTSLAGETFESKTWSEIDVVQWMARQPGARARYTVSDDRLGERVRERTVADMIEAARAAGAPVERGDGTTTVEVVAGITTTLGGLAVDGSWQAAPGVWAVGADAGGFSTGGYASGLAHALVSGLAAAEAALA